MTDGDRPTAPPLVAPDGTAIDLTAGGGVVAPHALNFAAILNTVTKAYSYRWDEALKDSPTNALAMMRDSFYLALLQERQAAVATLNYEVKTKGPDPAKAKQVKDRLTRVVEEVPDWTGLLLNQLDALWYGRAGSQVEWARANDGLRKVVHHEPVNGDKIQYQWDRTPVVMVGLYTKLRVDGTDPEAIIPLDRGGYGLRLYKPVWRDRFVIHHHIASDADFFQGEMAGGIHGVGLRSKVYWSGWMRTEVLSWMLSFMEGVGASELIIFNYPAGNAEALKRATENAKKITNGVALLVARGPGESYPAVEQVSINANGVAVLKELIADYYEKHIERLFVGQSMSSGSDGEGSLGGSGRAAFAQNTKFQLIKMDAGRLGETLSRDLLGPAKRFNCPGCEDVRAWLEFACPDPEAKEKLETGLKLIQAGFALKVDEVMELAGFTVPGPGDKAVGGQPPTQPGQPPGAGGAPPGGPAPVPGQPAAPQGDAAGGDQADAGVADLMEMFASGPVETYAGTPAQWQSHTLASGPRAGQTVYKNQTTGEIRDTPPTAAEGGATPQGQPQTRQTPPPAGAAGNGAPPQAGNAQPGQQEQQAQAKLASLPLDEPTRASLWASIKAIAAAGPKAVRIARAVVSTCYEEAKIWGTRLALAGVTYEDALPDAKELSNPLTGSTSATGGVDMVANATGIPAAQFVFTKIVPPVAGLVVGKLKAAFGRRKAAGGPEGYADTSAVVAAFRQALATKFAGAFRQAAGQEGGPPGALPPEAYSFDEGDHPRDDHGRFVSSDEINDALNEPDKIAALRARVTDPAQREKLDIALGEYEPEPDPEPEEGDDDELDHTPTHGRWQGEDGDLGEESDLAEEDPDDDKTHARAKAKAVKELERSQAKEDKEAEKAWKVKHKERGSRQEEESDQFEADHARRLAEADARVDSVFDEHERQTDELDSRHQAELGTLGEDDPSRPFVEKRQARERKVFLAKLAAVEAAAAAERKVIQSGYLPAWKALTARHAQEDKDAEREEKAEERARWDRHYAEPDALEARLDAEWREKRRAAWLAAHRDRYRQRLTADPAAHNSYYTPAEHQRYGVPAP